MVTKYEILNLRMAKLVLPYEMMSITLEKV